MPPLPTWFLLTVLGVFGLLFGSFANVVIWRLPRGESLSHPPSHCPRCGHAVRWYDNVPVVSWLALRGRCRDCGEAIAWRYPAVELLSASLWVAAGIAFGASARTVWAVAFFYLLLILAFIDLDLRRLPNVLVGALAAVGLAGVLVWQFAGLPATPLIGTAAEGLWSQPVASAALGILLGAGVSLAIALLYGLVRGRQGLGMGDVKLLGAMGLYLGPFVLLAYLLGTLVGAVAAVVAIVAAKRSTGHARARAEDEAGSSSASPLTIPFGPWLALGAVLTTLWGPAIWAWYAALARLG
jgi:leader peptidase (prepilin peptidase) / N-methyltransferase